MRLVEALRGMISHADSPEIVEVRPPWARTRQSDYAALRSHMTNEDYIKTQKQLTEWMSAPGKELFRRATPQERFQSNREYVPLEEGLDAVHEGIRNLLDDDMTLRSLLEVKPKAELYDNAEANHLAHGNDLPNELTQANADTNPADPVDHSGQDHVHDNDKQ